MKVTCKCFICDGPVEVEFVSEPTEEEKGGWLCEPCAVEWEAEHGDDSPPTGYASLD